jgi:hypothetical protein
MSPATRALQGEHRMRLLTDLARISTAADKDKEVIVRLFLPLSRHERALHPHNLIIRGERGAGKTALFHFLEAMKSRPDDVRRVFPNAQLPESLEWIEGFSEARPHPEVTLIDEFARKASNEDLRLFWVAHLACVLGSARILVSEPPSAVQDPWRRGESPAVWVAAAREHLATLSRALDETDRSLIERQKTVFVSYDHLDKVGLFQGETRERFTGTLLALWLSLSNRMSHLRPKIFVREDLFEASRTAFPDASKLESRSVSLDWNTEALYRVLIRHMAEISDDMREWLQTGMNCVPLRDDPVLGYLPPEAFPEKGRPSQASFVDHLAGPQMGSGVRKGYTYRWIPARLQDAHKRIVPRSLLNLVALSAREAQSSQKATHHRLITPGDLHRALEETSRRRVEEVREEHKVVARLAQLKGMNVLLPAATVRNRLARLPDGYEQDGFGDDGAAVMRELLRLGVLQRRADGRIDVPDIYRYGFKIKRKGGVAQPR